MDQDQITKWTRRGIREPKPVKIDDPEIELMSLEAVNYFGMKIKALDPSWFHKRTVLQSTNHIFSRPSDCVAILNVWDLGTTAGTVLDASNASPININITSHGFEDGELVTVQSTGGNTAANGTWYITYVDDDNFTLDGSTGNGAWTSGGIAYKEPTDPYRMTRKTDKTISNVDPYTWYPRDDKIIVDDITFSNDIILDYDRAPSAITDIPAIYHMGIVAFNVIHLITIPDRTPETQADFFDKIAQQKKARELLATIEDQIASTMVIAHETPEIPDAVGWDSLVEGP